MSELTLSEAIRLGAMWSPQGRLGYMDGVERCALGAAADAVGIKGVVYHDEPRPIIDYDALKARWPVLRGTSKCPACTNYLTGTNDAIWHLNDWHKWTRERIADWVATIEAAQEVSEPVLAHVQS